MTPKQSVSGEQDLKVFRLNEFDWWAGYDLESVNAAYLKECGYEDSPDEALENPHELSDADLDRFTFIYVDREEGDPEQSTFRERLKVLAALNAEVPCFFASTEW